MPITVLAGFLGAGKTTMLNRILAGDHGRRVAVLVNDFGTVNIDSRLVVSRDATMLTLDNGCVCCSVSADLVSQLTRLLEGDDAPEHVIIETSGVSDPGRVVRALRDPHLDALARVDGVITLVDAAGARDIPPALQELARRQLAAADVIVLNKADLVSPKEIAEVRAWISHPRARLVATSHADVPFAALFGAGPADRDASADGLSDEPDHGDRFATWAWTTEEPLDLRGVWETLGSLPDSVYRAKGFLHLADAPARPVVAHVVGRRVDLRPFGSWNDRPPRTELVFISLEADIDSASLRRRLEATVDA